jgi:hypothetical protein
MENDAETAGGQNGVSRKDGLKRFGGGIEASRPLTAACG